MIRLEEKRSVDAYEEKGRKRESYGADPLTTLIELENKEEIERSLEILLKELNPIQKEILIRTSEGESIKEIASDLNRNHATIIGCQKSIGRKLNSIANEDRISELCVQLKEMQSKGKRGRKYQKLKEEYSRRYKVREALKKLFAALTASPAPIVNTNKSVPPTCLFERMMGTSPCRLPQYFKDSFGDERTVCSLCECRCGNKKSLE